MLPKKDLSLISFQQRSVRNFPSKQAGESASLEGHCYVLAVSRAKAHSLPSRDGQCREIIWVDFVKETLFWGLVLL
jgi:hypothetical protein